MRIYDSLGSRILYFYFTCDANACLSCLGVFVDITLLANLL